MDKRVEIVTEPIFNSNGKEIGHRLLTDISPAGLAQELQRIPPVCKWCTKPFTPNPRNHTGKNQDFCNSKCRWAYWDKQNPRTRRAPSEPNSDRQYMTDHTQREK